MTKLKLFEIINAKMTDQEFDQWVKDNLEVWHGDENRGEGFWVTNILMKLERLVDNLIKKK